ncbi:hypothetical protein POTOM_036103 [Populus tomentosa]|uniref:Glutaminyl-tRNA synthetase n=1 Tax=Populus tomentosa TaxID=118781 RepID=A0A8X8CMP3_POPTO|nr:hypothetical protein POTOM_036103 [Populus tomentosa]
MAVKEEERLELFLKIGLDERTARNTIANNKVTNNLTAVIHEAGVTEGCNRTIGNLLYTVATKYPANALIHRPALLGYIVTTKIKTPAQLEAAFSFLSSTASESFELKGFEEACGVGVEVSEEDIERTVNEVFEQNKGLILELRYRTNDCYFYLVLWATVVISLVLGFLHHHDNVGLSPGLMLLLIWAIREWKLKLALVYTVTRVITPYQREKGERMGDLFGHVRKRLPWADPKIVMKLIDAKLYELLGGRTAADNEKPSKQKKERPAKVEDKKVADDNPVQPPEDLNPFLIFPNPEENFKVHTEIFFSDRPVLQCCNTKEVLDKHLKRTSRKVYTRFPPEPNGYLHIGHAKAMFVSFGLAKERGGCCYLRYDDTNPEAEKKEYIDHIEEIVEWMGWKPFKITYTSDYFQELYELAVELIQRGHAYVDHQTPEEIKEYREKKMNSPWRDRPIAESLKLFEEMRQGMIEEGKATLRMKQDMQSDNGNMYDLIAYRIKASFTPHPHSGDKWCIYPSYDYAHCIVDSLEDITHSLCTLEFETRRASYYWLLHVLDLYQPYVWEYSRLNVTNNVMSKRKASNHFLNFLVTKKLVDGWDDPRLMTSWFKA